MLRHSLRRAVPNGNSSRDVMLGFGSLIASGVWHHSTTASYSTWFSTLAASQFSPFHPAPAGSLTSDMFRNVRNSAGFASQADDSFVLTEINKALFETTTTSADETMI